MGFSDPHWAKIKSQAISDAMIKIIPLEWKLVKIDYSQETAFTKSLERAFKNSKPRYLAVRTWSGSDNVSWFFIHYLDKEELDKLHGKLINSTRELEASFVELFDVRMHPHQSNRRRFSISTALRPDLIISRMEIFPRYLYSLLHLAIRYSTTNWRNKHNNYTRSRHVFPT